MKVCSITVLPTGRGRPFDLVFYGLDASVLMTVGRGVGGDIVRSALKRRGLDADAFMSSPFYVTRLHSIGTDDPDAPIRTRMPRVVPLKARKTR